MYSKDNRCSESSINIASQLLPLLSPKKTSATSNIQNNHLLRQRVKQKYSTIFDDQETIQIQEQIKDYSLKQKPVAVLNRAMIVSEKVLSSIEPFRKQRDLMKKPNSIDYVGLINNMCSFPTAQGSGAYRASRSNRFNQVNHANQGNRTRNQCQIKRNNLKQCEVYANLYRSVPKKPTNISTIDSNLTNREKSVKNQRHFFHISRMNLGGIPQQTHKLFNTNVDNCQQSLILKCRRNMLLGVGTVEHDQLQQNDVSVSQNFILPKLANSSRHKYSTIGYGIESANELIKQQVNNQCPDNVNIDSSAPQIESNHEPTSPLQLNQSPVKKHSLSKKRVRQLSVPFQTYYYRSMIWKINNSNEMYVEVPSQYDHRLRAYIGKGNNSCLIRAMIKRRIWFAVTDRVEDANFVWTQLKSLPFFKLQSHSQRTHQTHQIPSQQPIYTQKPSFCTYNDQKKYQKYLSTHLNVEQKADQRLLIRNKYFKYSKSIKSNEIKTIRVQNHLINNYVIGNKKALFHTMNNYYKQTNQQVFHYLPLTFHVRGGLQDPTYYNFLKQYYKRAKQIKALDSNSKNHNIWIVKPGENSNRGHGIKVCLTLEQIKKILRKKQFYHDGTCRTYILQSYIDKPLLYHKRKFDLRHYIMISCVNGIVKGYWYRDGYVRTTSTEYNLVKNCSKIHLTNDAIQKNLPEYGKYEKGNKISYDELQNYIKKIANRKKQDIGFKKDILPKMKKIGTDTIRACSCTIDPELRQDNFQVFGLDFMIDSNFQVYLIQANSNPCLEISCPLLGTIIPRMIENTLEMSLDTHFPPPVRYCPKGMHYFKNLEQQNRYELVYDSRVEKMYESSDVLDEKLLAEEDDVFEDDGQEDEYDPDY